MWMEGIKEMVGIKITINKQIQEPLCWSATGSGIAGTRQGEKDIAWNQPQRVGQEGCEHSRHVTKWSSRFLSELSLCC